MPSLCYVGADDTRDRGKVSYYFYLTHLILVILCGQERPQYRSIPDTKDY